MHKDCHTPHFQQERVSEVGFGPNPSREPFFSVYARIPYNIFLGAPARERFQTFSNARATRDFLRYDLSKQPFSMHFNTKSNL